MKNAGEYETIVEYIWKTERNRLYRSNCRCSTVSPQ